jgi:hypothetical protein
MKCDGYVLTFEKDTKLLGVVFMNKGKNHNLFVHEYVIENTPEVKREMYLQYALLKLHELEDFHTIQYHPSKVILDTFDEEKAHRFGLSIEASNIMVYQHKKKLMGVEEFERI